VRLQVQADFDGQFGVRAQHPIEVDGHPLRIVHGPGAMPLGRRIRTRGQPLRSSVIGTLTFS
jgi:hypothetical protein